jgi:hypothetical protein
MRIAWIWVRENELLKKSIWLDLEIKCHLMLVRVLLGVQIASCTQHLSPIPPTVLSFITALDQKQLNIWFCWWSLPNKKAFCSTEVVCHSLAGYSWDILAWILSGGQHLEESLFAWTVLALDSVGFWLSSCTVSLTTQWNPHGAIPIQFTCHLYLYCMSCELVSAYIAMMVHKVGKVFWSECCFWKSVSPKWQVIKWNKIPIQSPKSLLKILSANL